MPGNILLRSLFVMLCIEWGVVNRAVTHQKFQKANEFMVYLCAIPFRKFSADCLAVAHILVPWATKTAHVYIRQQPAIACGWNLFMSGIHNQTGDLVSPC